MPDFRLSGLKSIALGVPDVAADATFYTDVWGLTAIAQDRDSVYLRGSGAYHHILALHPRANAQVLSITFDARSSADVDALHAEVKAGGAGAVTAPAPVPEPGGGYGFAFKDPEGRILRVIADDARHADVEAVADRPQRLSHVVLNSTDVARASQFLTGKLGFRLSDRTRMMDFIRCNRDHHSVAFCRGSAATLHHIAFLMPDLDSVMRGTGRMRDHGWSIDWGVGRHGPGNNVFAYFVGPHDVVIEYTAEVDEVDDDYKVGGPDDWAWPLGRTDRWGVTGPPSQRMHAAQQKIAFAEEFA